MTQKRPKPYIFTPDALRMASCFVYSKLHLEHSSDSPNLIFDYPAQETLAQIERNILETYELLSQEFGKNNRSIDLAPVINQLFKDMPPTIKRDSAVETVKNLISAALALTTYEVIKDESALPDNVYVKP